MRNRFTAGLLAATVGAGLLAVGAPGAQAGSGGRKNTMIGLGAATAYELLKGNTTAGLIGAAGTAYAYKRYHDARNDERLYNYNRNGRRVPTYRSRRSSRPASDGSVFQFPNSYNGSGYGGTYQSQNGGRWGKGGYGGDTYQTQNGGYYQNDGTPCPRNGSSAGTSSYRYSRYGDGYQSQGRGDYRRDRRDR